MAEESSKKPDPRFEPDGERIHRPILREPRDPREGYERAPWWLWAGVVATVFFNGFYLGRFGGDFGLGTHEAYRETEAVAERVKTETKAPPRLDPIAHGRAVYEQRCQACHQSTGQGLGGAFPPLLASDWVTGPAERLVAIVLHGMSGPVEVVGKTYNGSMPAWGEQLSDREIAAVATFVRQWDANDAQPVSTEKVALLRQRTLDRTTPWNAGELVTEFP